MKKVKKEEERASKARPNIEDAPDVVTRDDVACTSANRAPELAGAVRAMFCGSRPSPRFEAAASRKSSLAQLLPSGSGQGPDRHVTTQSLLLPSLPPLGSSRWPLDATFTTSRLISSTFVLAVC